MTIRESLAGRAAGVVAWFDASRSFHPVVAGLSVMVGVVAVAACGQRGPLRLPAPLRPAAVQVPAPSGAASAVDARDPFSAPSPTAAPASVPRP